VKKYQIRHDETCSVLHEFIGECAPSFAPVYLASDADARIIDLEGAFNASTLLSGEVIEERNKRIAELEKALREAIRWNWNKHAPSAEVEAQVNKALGL
jgi:hypothetical protein